MNSYGIHNLWVQRLVRADFELILSDSGYLWFTHGGAICAATTAISLIRYPGTYDLTPANHDWLVANGDRLLAAVTAARLRR